MDVDQDKEIQIWISGIDEPVASFNRSEFLGVVPEIGDAVKLPLEEKETEYFRVTERYFSPGSHCSLTVEPMSGKGFEYKQALLQKEVL